ncbi:MAG TPA: DUF2339 domain-containing protein [Pyrinomonadaceae bacterium]|nr:DUF2339 domain-containing protein [Pyrinomonadaceae bacterium]
MEVPTPMFGSGNSATDRQAPPKPDPVSEFFSKHTESARGDLEKFIGENLISKIGILVLIIGIGIGVKYSIDNNLISPLTRIILAYIFAFALVGLAIKLKPKYLNFSSALISGGMATMYFVTYFAYTAYGLIGQLPTFGLMAICTIFTVIAALFFNRQVIAHIGLVGAYAVPFLLSTDSGNYLALFGYMAIINIGILAISVKKYWRPIFYTASIFTWFIFLVWFASKYSPETHFSLALTFLGVFFGIFLGTKLTHAIIHDEHDSDEGLLAVVITALVFYAFCFVISAVGLSLSQTWDFFAYLAAITALLSIVSFRFIGKTVAYVAFGATWLIYGAWFLGNYSGENHFILASVYAAVFFSIFYASTLVHRLLNANFSVIENSGLVLTNSFLFYGFGYAILNGTESTAGSLGLYTAAHAALHLAVAFVISKVRPAAVDVVQVLTVLVLTFASIAIPVQLDGNQVTMAWSVEAAILFWFGRARSVRLFELYSYPVMLLATGSLFFDWGTAYFNRTGYSSDFNLQPFANGNFVTALVYIAAFSVIFWVSRDNESEETKISAYSRPFGYLIVGLALFVLYNTFRLEISNYFHLRSVGLIEAGVDAGTRAFRNNFNFNVIWQINYTLLFLAAMAFVNILKVRSAVLAYVNAILAVGSLGLLATAGMIIFHDLRVSYMAGEGDYSLVSVRFASYVAAAVLLFALYLYSRDKLLIERMPAWASEIGFEAVAYSFCFIVASCELVNTMAQLGLPDATKLGLSIFWGIYALMLIIVGIARNRKHLRVAAIVLLGVTLAKLFFYDVADLGTIPRTILFVSLGLTLLVISFLYNKYKNAIFGFAEGSEE